MPLAALHLVSIKPSTTLSSFLSIIRSLPREQQPIITSKVIRWIITPELIDTNPLLSPSKPYDLLLIFPSTTVLPSSVTTHFHDDFHLQVGIPSRLLKDFHNANNKLIHPSSSDVPALTGSLSQPITYESSQSLALSPSLNTWIKTFSTTRTGQSPLSMLNLLAFIPARKDSYLHYGAEFAKSIGSKRGGTAKLVGHTIYPSTPAQPASGEAQSPKWDEFALAQYPSIMHFADMLASKDYQDVNQKYRVPALRDTCILCTSELEIEEIMNEKEGAKAKL